MFEPTREDFLDTGQVRLHIAEWGAADAPPVVLVHGIRDHAFGFGEVAAGIAASGRRVIGFDLRGHGDSEAPGIYSMPHFATDLAALIETRALEHPVLLGHSLGGHICMFYAGLHPGVPAAIINVEGLGPPPRPGHGTAAAALMQFRRVFDTARHTSSRQRPLPSLEFAIERLLANNPRLSAERAHDLAAHGTRNSEAGMVWKFDPRVQNVWASANHAETPALWAQITCPVQVILGGQSADYWTRQMPAADWDARWTEAALAERLAPLGNVRVEHIDDAGHMVHYDTPDKLVSLATQFLDSLQ